jgi:hypothetical protein
MARRQLLESSRGSEVGGRRDDRVAGLSIFRKQYSDRAFHGLGLTRRGWFAISKRTPDHRTRMTKLLENFKAARIEAPSGRLSISRERTARAEIPFHTLIQIKARVPG